MGILHQAITNPNYRGITGRRDPVYTPKEGYCPTCQSFTTNYNNHGECSECGTSVREGVEEE